MIKLNKVLENRENVYPYYYSETHIATNYWMARRSAVKDCYKHICALMPGQSMPDLDRVQKEGASGLRYKKSPWIFVAETPKKGKMPHTTIMCRRFDAVDGLSAPSWLNELHVNAFGLEEVQRYNDESEPGLVMSLSHGESELYVMELRNPVQNVDAKVSKNDNNNGN